MAEHNEMLLKYEQNVISESHHASLNQKLGSMFSERRYSTDHQSTGTVDWDLLLNSDKIDNGIHDFKDVKPCVKCLSDVLSNCDVLNPNIPPSIKLDPNKMDNGETISSDLSQNLVKQEIQSYSASICGVKQEIMYCQFCSHCDVDFDRLKFHVFGKHPTEAAFISYSLDGAKCHLQDIKLFCVKETCTFATTFCNVYEDHLMSCCPLHQTFSENEEKRLMSTFKFILDFHKKYRFSVVSGFEDYMSTFNTISVCQEDKGQTSKDVKYNNSLSMSTGSASILDGSAIYGDVRMKIVEHNSSSTFPILTLNKDLNSTLSKADNYGSTSCSVGEKRNNVQLTKAKPFNCTVTSASEGETYLTQSGKDRIVPESITMDVDVAGSSTDCYPLMEETVHNKIKEEETCGGDSYTTDLDVSTQQTGKITRTTSGTQTEFHYSDVIRTNTFDFHNDKLPDNLYSDVTRTDAFDFHKDKTPDSGDEYCDIMKSDSGQRTFKTNGGENFLIRQETHTGDRPFKCNQCGKMFRQKFLMAYKTQTGGKKFIIAHRTNTGDNPVNVKCNDCKNTRNQGMCDGDSYTTDLDVSTQHTGKITRMTPQTQALGNTEDLYGVVIRTNTNHFHTDKTPDDLNSDVTRTDTSHFHIDKTPDDLNSDVTRTDTSRFHKDKTPDDLNSDVTRTDTSCFHKDKKTPDDLNSDVTRTDTSQFHIDKTPDDLNSDVTRTDTSRFHKDKTPDDLNSDVTRTDTSCFHKDKTPDDLNSDVTRADTSHFHNNKTPDDQCSDVTRTETSLLHNNKTPDNLNSDVTRTDISDFHDDSGQRKFKTNGGENSLIRQETQTGDKPFKCNECGKMFSQKFLMAYKTQTGENKFIIVHRTNTGDNPVNVKCNDCKDTWDQKFMILCSETDRKDLELEVEDKQYKYDECDKTFCHETSHNTHRRKHTGEKPFQCDACGKTFQQRRSLNIHRKIHTGKPFKCNECDKSFSSKGSLKVHRRIHTGEKPYQCNTCGKTFHHISGLNFHRTTHTGEKPYKCNECGKTFRETGSLSIHRRQHTGEKPYQCDACGKTFHQSNSLNIHRRIHTGEKPFKCNECGKTFRQTGSLKIHRRIHTGEKPFKCSECGKAFRQTGSLKVHRRIHTGEKPYQCDECGKTFNQCSSLNIHRSKHTE